MEKVLVTGGAGFIGSHIVEELLDEGIYKVGVVDNLSTGDVSNIPLNKITYYNADITREKEINKVIQEFLPDFIIHQAAQVSVAESVSNIIKDEEINIRGSLNIIESARNNNVKKIVFASSAAVYGNPKYLPVDEEHPINPASPYGLSKYTVEKYLELANRLYGVKYTILRYSNVYGPRQGMKGEGGVVSIFVDKLAKKETVAIFGDGKQTRDFIYVKDVAKANINALKNGDNTVVNISTMSQITINELYNTISNLYNNNNKPSYLETRNGDIVDSTLSNKKAQKYLEWHPVFNVQGGLFNIIEGNAVLK
ncbi:NAD-dependent epimerase/dehydratase family protein [Priestia megaterium]|uniref:NAD-dependent epimerase/dehydratase family protein n=1 Tax=Priestia megaterium TaxID=1404 RepID=UPI00234E592B|nr:NAD-dependent epimerase/dehydratase family protein [Priestia megaterium]MDC7771447.1 NAD-dependent epimerase/dehydratase family protein [Priestia megaterium]